MRGGGGRGGEGDIVQMYLGQVGGGRVLIGRGRTSTSLLTNHGYGG
jgi:hypothetical protein